MYLCLKIYPHAGTWKGQSLQAGGLYIWVDFRTALTVLVYVLQAQDKPEDRVDPTAMYNLLTLAELRADTQVETGKPVRQLVQ